MSDLTNRLPRVKYTRKKLNIILLLHRLCKCMSIWKHFCKNYRKRNSILCLSNLNDLLNSLIIVYLLLITDVKL